MNFVFQLHLVGFFFFFHHSLLLAWWRAIRKHLPVLFLFLTVALHISHTYRHAHIHTSLGHRRQMLHCLTTSRVPRHAHTFHSLHSKCFFFFCHASFSPPIVCYTNIHLAHDKGCNMLPMPLTDMPKGTLVKIQASLQTTILSFFFYPVGFIPQARRAFWKL